MKLSFNLSWAIFACFFGLIAVLELSVYAYFKSHLVVVTVLFAYAVVVTFSLSVLCYVSGFLGNKVFCGAISLFFVFILACTKLSLSKFFIFLPESVIATFLIVLFSALLFLFLQMEKKRLFPTLIFYATTASIFLLIPFILSAGSFFLEVKAIAESEDTLADWSDIKFSEKPHVFIISYDAMIPQETAEQYMGIKPAYQAVLDEEFIEVKKGVVLRVATKPSLNAVMSLDQASLTGRSGYFIGDKPSVLATIAHGNGYKIVTGFGYGFWRHNNSKPPYIDEYLSSEVLHFDKSPLCLDVGDNTLLESRGYFFCQANKKIKEHFPEFVGKFLTDNKTWNLVVQAHIRDLAEDDPHISFFYIYSPISHVSSGFNYNNATHLKEYKGHFSFQAKKLALELNTLVALIKENHPDSILLVFGDHGAFLSRGLKPVTAQEFEFRLKDLHRVAVALMKTENRCVKGFQVDENRDYYTPSMVLVELFECLESSNVLPSLIDYDEYQKELLLEHAF